jgi:hypothetical protein
MPLKIRHPNWNGTVPRKHFVAHGACDDSANVTGYLTPKAGGRNINGKLDKKLKKHWGLIFKKVPDGDYTLHVFETGKTISLRGTPVTTVASDQVDLTVAAVAPPVLPAPVPDVVFPCTGDTVGGTFYPYGTSQSSIVDPNGINFYDSGITNQEYGGLLQDIDADGFWYGIIENVDSWDTTLSYSIDVQNTSGIKTNTSITLQP